jgi:peptidoglycan/LPS O-acetylase OafA/YrhL
VTDTIKALLGGTPESAWGPLIADNLLLILLVLAAVVLLAILAYRFIRRNTPRPEHKMGWRADDNTERPTPDEFTRARRALYARIFDVDLLEKIVLVSFIVYIFARILPSVEAPSGSVISAYVQGLLNGTRLIIYVAVLVTSTTAVSHLIARRNLAAGQATLISGVAHFAAVFALNMAIVFVVLTLFGRPINWFNAIVFQTLLAVIVTLFDRFQPFYEARFPRNKELEIRN